MAELVLELLRPELQCKELRRKIKDFRLSIRIRSQAEHTVYSPVLGRLPCSFICLDRTTLGRVLELNSVACLESCVRDCGKTYLTQRVLEECTLGLHAECSRVDPRSVDLTEHRSGVARKGGDSIQRQGEVVRLIPHEEKFFELFAELSGYVIEGAKLLRSILENPR